VTRGQGEKTLEFPSREVRPYATPVAIEELKVGELYFSATYLDDDRLIPHIYPVVYLGRDLPSIGSGLLAFQEAGSYRSGIDVENLGEDDEVAIDCFSSDQTLTIYSFDEVLNTVLACALRRQKS